MARAMRSGREQGARIPRATLRFVAAGVVAMVVVAVVGSVLSGHLGEQEAIRQVQRLAEVLGSEVIEPNLVDSLESAESRLRLDRVVRESVLPVGVVRVKLWNSSGRIVYSDEPRLIGAFYPLGEQEQVVIATGETQAEVTDLSEPENAYEKQAGKLLEVYVPVKALDGQSMLFEMYMPYRWVSASSRRVWLAFVPLFLGALAALQLVQVPLARSNGPAPAGRPTRSRTTAPSRGGGVRYGAAPHRRRHPRRSRPGHHRCLVPVGGHRRGGPPARPGPGCSEAVG